MASPLGRALIGIGQSGAAQNIPALINLGMQYDMHQTQKRAIEFKTQQEQEQVMDENRLIPFDAAMDAFNVPNDPEIRKEFLNKGMGIGVVQTLQPPPEAVNLPGGTAVPPTTGAKPSYAIRKRDLETFNKAVDQSPDFKENILNTMAFKYQDLAQTTRNEIDAYKAKNPGTTPETDIKLAGLQGKLAEYNKQNEAYVKKALYAGQAKELMKTYTFESIQKWASGQGELVPLKDKAESPYGKINPSDYTPESLTKFNQTGNVADLAPRPKMDTISPDQKITQSAIDYINKSAKGLPITELEKQSYEQKFGADPVMREAKDLWQKAYQAWLSPMGAMGEGEPPTIETFIPQAEQIVKSRQPGSKDLLKMSEDAENAIALIQSSKLTSAEKQRRIGIIKQREGIK